MKSLRNDAHNFFDNTHVRSKTYQQFYHGIIYINNEGRHIIILYTHINILNLI